MGKPLRLDLSPAVTRDDCVEQHSTRGQESLSSREELVHVNVCEGEGPGRAAGREEDEPEGNNMGTAQGPSPLWLGQGSHQSRSQCASHRPESGDRLGGAGRKPFGEWRTGVAFAPVVVNVGEKRKGGVHSSKAPPVSVLWP